MKSLDNLAINQATKSQERWVGPYNLLLLFFVCDVCITKAFGQLGLGG